MRSRRRVTIELHAALNTARFRDPDLPFQRLVLATSWVVALVQVLVQWLDRQELTIRIAWPDGLDAEKQILALILSDGLKAGWLSFSSNEELLTKLEHDATRAPTDWICLQSSPTDRTPRAHIWQHQLVVDQRPVFSSDLGPEVVSQHTSIDAWKATLRSALEALL